MSTKQLDIRVGNPDYDHDAAVIKRGLNQFLMSH